MSEEEGAVLENCLEHARKMSTRQSHTSDCDL